jgi:predicted NAD-dependent protein-ADP-ribosyltransferase YbiA (DUF1768 family)
MNLPTRVGCFKGPWGFLSNFAPAKVKLWIDERSVPCAHDFHPFIALDVEEYESVEHGYHAAKFLDPKIRALFRLNISPSEAKAQAHKLKDKVRSDWKEVSLVIMKDLVLQKFTGSILRRKLLSTFQAELIEGNWWHDNFFGNGFCSG